MFPPNVAPLSFTQLLAYSDPELTIWDPVETSTTKLELFVLTIYDVVSMPLAEVLKSVSVAFEAKSSVNPSNFYVWFVASAGWPPKKSNIPALATFKQLTIAIETIKSTKIFLIFIISHQKCLWKNKG